VISKIYLELLNVDKACFLVVIRRALSPRQTLQAVVVAVVAAATTRRVNKVVLAAMMKIR
jgi:hypothetical protein